MATDIDLANVALALVGQMHITTLDDTVHSTVIPVINRFLPLAKHESLSARDWNCARARAEISSVTNESNGEWAYAYRLPSDYLTMRRFASVTPEVAHAAYSVESDSTDKKILYTSCGINCIVYTKRLDDVNRWSPALFHACAVRLAWYLTGAFVRDAKLQQVKLQEFLEAFTEAVGIDEAEGNLESVITRDLVTVRG